MNFIKMPVKTISSFFLILILTLASYITVNAQSTVTQSGVPGNTLNSKYKGLQISRTDLVTGLSTIDSLMHFKEIPGVKGLPKLSAKGSNGTRVEITGTENNVTKAQWTMVQANPNKLAFTRMAFFVNILAKQDGVTWFFQQAFNYNQNPTNPINSSTLIDGNKVLFVFDPAKKTFTLSVSVY